MLQGSKLCSASFGLPTVIMIIKAYAFCIAMAADGFAFGFAVCGQGAQPSRASASAAPQVLAPHQQPEGSALPGRARRDSGNDSGLCSRMHVTPCVGFGTLCTDIICKALHGKRAIPYVDGRCKRWVSALVHSVYEDFRMLLTYHCGRRLLMLHAISCTVAFHAQI